MRVIIDGSPEEFAALVDSMRMAVNDSGTRPDESLSNTESFVRSLVHQLLGDIPICFLEIKWVEKWVDKKFRTPENVVFSGVLAGDSSGIRTPDTLIKSQVLYRLS